MSRAVEFPCRVTGGRIPATVAEQIAALVRNADGKQIVVSVREVKRTRSLSQNNYLWGAVYPPVVARFREHGTMVDSEDVHLFCKQHVGKLRRVLVTPDGEVLHSVGSTRHLTTSEFAEYVESVRQFAAERMGINIPSPGEHFDQQPKETNQ